MMLKKKVLLISNPKLKKYYKKIITTYGSKLENIKKVRSHAQAISQCQKFITRKNLQPIITADTAGSAKYISENKIQSEAAIASSLAAKIYNLDTLAKDIEDESRNVTRFLVMGKNAYHPSLLKDKKYITSVIFKDNKLQKNNLSQYFSPIC